MKNRFSFSFLYAFLFIFGACQNKKTLKINQKEGNVEFVILNGTEFEKKIVYNKKDVFRKIENSPDSTIIYLSDHFCKEIDDRNLGASFFEMKFYDSKNNLELVLGSFSTITSIRSHKKQKINIVYDFKKNSYFPSKLINIPLR